MNYTRTNPNDSSVALAVTLDATDLLNIKKQTVARVAKQVKVAGFRPGKVPASVAEKNLDQNALNSEVAEDAINAFTLQLLEKEALQPLDRPQVEVQAYVPNESLTFTTAFEIVPPVKLGDYKKLKATKKVASITDSEIDEVIERMQSGLSEKKTVDRPAKEGDEVRIDFDGHDEEGKPVAGAKGTDYSLALGSHTFIPGFEEGIVGKKTGDTFDLPLTFPKDYHHAPLAGAKVTFAVTVKEIKEVLLPEINDEFAAKCGPFKTVAELRTDITRELQDQKEREALDKFKDELLGELIEKSTIPTPEVLINDQIEQLERDFTQNLLYRGMTLAQYLEQQGKTAEEWRNETLREQAIRRVKVGLCLAELSKLENIQVSKEELEKRLSELLEQYGNDEKIRTQLDTPETRRDISNQEVTRKTVDRLVELNTK